MKKLLLLLVFVICSIQVFATPISKWSFDECDGTTAYDSVNGNDGNIYGASWDTGKSGCGLYFDGTDYITVPRSVSLEPSSEITLEIQMRVGIIWKYPSTTATKAKKAHVNRYFIGFSEKAI